MEDPVSGHLHDLEHDIAILDFRKATSVTYVDTKSNAATKSANPGMFSILLVIMLNTPSLVCTSLISFPSNIVKDESDDLTTAEFFNKENCIRFFGVDKEKNYTLEKFLDAEKVNVEYHIIWIKFELYNN